MENYSDINNIYVQQFGLNPPVRVCVALGDNNLPTGIQSIYFILNSIFGLMVLGYLLELLDSRAAANVIIRIQYKSTSVCIHRI